MTSLLNKLERPTLVLNRSWLPVNVTPARNAICLVYRGVANVVHTRTFETFDFDGWIRRGPESNLFVRTVSFRIPVPEVVVLRKYDRMARRVVPFTRRNLFRRDQLRCQYCGGRPGAKQLTIDHVVPRSRGGMTNWTNCVVACARCNGRKGSRTPEQVGMKLRRSPRSPDWMSAFGEGIPWLRTFLRQSNRSG